MKAVFVMVLRTKFDKLQAENAALKAELEKEREWAEKCSDNLAAAEFGDKQIKAQLAAAQKDAERYRWLRDSEIDREIDVALWDGDQWAPWYGEAEELDAAIDKAMEAAK
jgi:hypothetical protein